MVYDILLLFAVLVVASALTLPFRAGKGATQFDPYMMMYIFGVIFVFFGWFWTHGGQTLGMRAWKIKLISRKTVSISWPAAFYRYVISLPVWLFLFYSLHSHNDRFGTETLLTQVPGWILYTAGLLWLFLDNIPGNWREKITHTSVVYQ
jgi:uncharacterized RDD family membrane protein YckC